MTSLKNKFYFNDIINLRESTDYFIEDKYQKQLFV